MPTSKLGIKHHQIDMVAFADVAFLLLIFFVVANRPKSPTPININLPSSTWTSSCAMMGGPKATILVGHDKIFFAMPDSAVKTRVLNGMAKKYHVQFTGQEQQRFSATPVFGMYVSQLKQFLNMTNYQRNTVAQPGIPFDKVNNDLANWIYEARLATKELYGRELRIAINADQNQSYPSILRIINVLQSQRVFRFELATNAKYPPHEH